VTIQPVTIQPVTIQPVTIQPVTIQPVTIPLRVRLAKPVRAAAESMSIELLPDDFWLLADPSQEVLMDRPPAFSQLAPVPLAQVGTDWTRVGEPHVPNSGTPVD
jgi:hypothetical protein